MFSFFILGKWKRLKTFYDFSIELLAKYAKQNEMCVEYMQR